MRRPVLGKNKDFVFLVTNESGVAYMALYSAMSHNISFTTYRIRHGLILYVGLDL